MVRHMVLPLTLAEADFLMESKEAEVRVPPDGTEEAKDTVSLIPLIDLTVTPVPSPVPEDDECMEIMDPVLSVGLDHDYDRGVGNQAEGLPDEILSSIFSFMSLKERTKFESCCQRFGSLIPDINKDSDWFDYLSYEFIRPKPFKDDTTTFAQLSRAYTSLFLKSKGIKRLTSEYFDEGQWIGFKYHRPKRRKFIRKLLARRPDFSEIVIDLRNEETWSCGKGFPYQFAIEILFTMMEEKCNHVTHFIFYSPDWDLIYEYMLAILLLAPEIRHLTIIFTDTAPAVEDDRMVEIWQKVASELHPVSRLDFIWRKPPAFYGFEEFLNDLEEIRIAPTDPESWRMVVENNPFLSKVELIGSFEMVDELCSARRLTHLTFYDFYEDRTMDQITWPLGMFLPADTSEVAKSVLNRLFLMTGHGLKSFHLNITRANVLLDPDLLAGLTMHAVNLTSLSLCFHRKSKIVLRDVVKGMKNLRTLKFSFWTTIEEVDVRSIINSCPKLRHMEYAVLYEPPYPETDSEDRSSISRSSESSSDGSDTPNIVVPDVQIPGIDFLHGADYDSDSQSVEDVVLIDDEEEEDGEVIELEQEMVQDVEEVDISFEGVEEMNQLPGKESSNAMEVEPQAGPSYTSKQHHTVSTGRELLNRILDEDVMVFEEEVQEQPVFENEVEIESQNPDYLFTEEESMVIPLASKLLREVMADVGLDMEEEYMRELINPWRHFARLHPRRNIRVIITATKEIPDNIADVSTLKRVLTKIVDLQEDNLFVTFCNPK